MSIASRVAALLLAMASVAILGGCVGDSPTQSASPSPSASPVFATEEDALAAAIEAFQAYGQLSDQIFAEGGAHPERIDSVAVGVAREEANASFRSFRERSYVAAGTTRFSNVTVQQYDPSAVGGEEVVSTYLCVDVSGVDVLDASGASVVSPDRPNTQAFEVGYEEVDGSLLVSRADSWDGGGVCPG